MSVPNYYSRYRQPLVYANTISSKCKIGESTPKSSSKSSKNSSGYFVASFDEPTESLIPPTVIIDQNSDIKKKEDKKNSQILENEKYEPQISLGSLDEPKQN